MEDLQIHQQSGLSLFQPFLNNFGFNICRFSQSTGSKKQENIGESIKELLIQMVIFDLKRDRMAKC